ncbi:Gfo/Idh/MocA family oxidoreductase [Romboutsia sp.]|uniref:Gfo/Idh/MocA family protein n=1 Tax=Romboutsia sp. TaxID=1965302 RepID=UPI002BB1261D|nr:Gfo/Idh/MocA family oxidoreductase [Romboutsia sp.]HSQ87957.1 Gfo/Idh/MocA family oxidoreductase [Romboutsia sp.]
MAIVKIAMIGAGIRGTYGYAPYIYENPNQSKIVSVVEPKKGRRELFADKYNIQENQVFESIQDFLEGEKIADAVIITSNDDSHYDNAKLLLEKGYDVLLENPVANTLDRLVKLKHLSEKYSDKVFMTCHVLRYTEFFNKLKQIVDDEDLGELISIQHNENIGYEYFVHSYTRGNWRNQSDTSPLILNKSCHDIDILMYITGSKCRKIASFGRLKHLNNEHFKENMGENCFTCRVEEQCPYSAKKIYLKNDRYINYALHINPTKENLEQILEKGPYGRCVYRCDNNVVDNMVSILEFENDVTATFNLSAFTKECDRTIKLMFSHGEVGGSLLKNEIKIKKFTQQEEETIHVGQNVDLYTEGDKKLIKDFISLIDNKGRIKPKYACSVKDAIESHIVAFASEYSRISEEVVCIKDFFEDAAYMTNEIEETLI